jgi:sigma-B regulation protein RsbU (phosphoserine phosphatase)
MANQKILIVDDEPFNIDYLEQELEELNYVTFTASNGLEALDKISEVSPDLVLLDIMMPVMDGFEVLKRLKDNPGTHDIPVIIISANNGLKGVVKGIELGAEDYLPKPFEPTLLHARISACLIKKQLLDLQKKYLKSLEREFEIAHEIQMGFLPAELPILEGWEVGAYFKAAREVAGDYYDAFLLPNGNLFCTVGDVCGKGIGAALFMTLFRSLVRATAMSSFSDAATTQSISSTGEILKYVVSFTNKYVTETHGDESTFSTLFVGIFDIKNGNLTYINCGNEPPLLLRKDKVIIPLNSTGPLVGVFPEANFSIAETTLSKGDLFLAFTDGIPDAINKDGISFGKDQINELRNVTYLPANQFIQNITEPLLQFTHDTNQFDDITLLVVKRNI